MLYIIMKQFHTTSHYNCSIDTVSLGLAYLMNPCSMLSCRPVGWPKKRVFSPQIGLLLVCVYVCVCACVCVLHSACVSIYVHLYVHMLCACMHACARAHMCVCVRVCVCVCMSYMPTIPLFQVS